MEVNENELTEELINKALENDECIQVIREENDGCRTYGEQTWSENDS
jgi:hypothetical protein